VFPGEGVDQPVDLAVQAAQLDREGVKIRRHGLIPLPARIGVRIIRPVVTVVSSAHVISL
jgi:hypothetical protein